MLPITYRAPGRRHSTWHNPGRCAGQQLGPPAPSGRSPASVNSVGVDSLVAWPSTINCLGTRARPGSNCPSKQYRERSRRTRPGWEEGRICRRHPLGRQVWPTLPPRLTSPSTTCRGRTRRRGRRKPTCELWRHRSAFAMSSRSRCAPVVLVRCAAHLIVGVLRAGGPDLLTSDAPATVDPGGLGCIARVRSRPARRTAGTRKSPRNVLAAECCF